MCTDRIYINCVYVASGPSSIMVVEQLAVLAAFSIHPFAMCSAPKWTCAVGGGAAERDHRAWGENPPIHGSRGHLFARYRRFALAHCNISRYISTSSRYCHTVAVASCVSGSGTGTGSVLAFPSIPFCVWSPIAIDGENGSCWRGIHAAEDTYTSVPRRTNVNRRIPEK